MTRLLKALSNPAETAVLGNSILRELHYRILVGPQASAMIAALSQRGMAGRITQSIARLKESFCSEISIAALASDASMSVPSYHAHFKRLTGTSPIQYVKAMRLHQARALLARQDRTVAESPCQWAMSVLLSLAVTSKSVFAVLQRKRSDGFADILLRCSASNDAMSAVAASGR